MSETGQSDYLEIQDLFDTTNRKRVPKIAVTTKETILAFNHGCRRLRRSTDGGTTWSEAQEIGAVGNLVVDETTGDILIIRPTESIQWRSTDDGETWRTEPMTVKPNLAGHGTAENSPAEGSCSETGITLRHGEHSGRLLLPMRIQPPAGNNDQEYWCYNYNTSIYSDDHGATWQVGEPMQSGTGEGTLAELSNGKIYFNSRCHMAVDAKRRIAWSHDGGYRWVDWQVCETLKEAGEPFYFRYGSKPSYGCNAGLVRLPDETTNGKDILLFSTPDNPGGTRIRMTVWASFDGGLNWPVKKVVYPGPSAYSSLTADKNGKIYLLFERGKSANLGSDIDHYRLTLATFNLDWVLDPGR